MAFPLLGRFTRFSFGLALSGLLITSCGRSEQAVGSTPTEVAPTAVAATVPVAAIASPSPGSTLTPTASPSPTPPLTPTPTLTADQAREAHLAAKVQLASARAMAVVPMDQGVLWQWLAGFSGKTNQERESYIAGQLFPAAGVEDVHLQRVLYGGAWGEEYGNWDNLHNVIGLRRGTLPADQRKTIVIGAHFDKVTYPGRSANPGFSDGILDNATGVALIASLAQATSRPFNDIEFVAFASEEPPPYFNGSRLFFSQAENTEQTIFYLNFDVLGRGNMAMIAGSADQGLASTALAVANDARVPLVWRPSSTNTASDDLVAQAAGLKVLAFACDGYDRLDIHVPEDNLSAIDQDAYYQHYVLALRILAYLDAWYSEP